ncbi:hypothetical protein Ahy_B08g093394 isoform H [Arachis hypogaea]|uniref:Pentatricopeptide repeat-containing protein n=1 Tax=Arachis hypogaea TaxID=3818 RepID=A0A444Y5Z6_ARAHY|nr:hypothetical protein Ahy_B08g093394 isoform H [Arachis hypogaea]
MQLPAAAARAPTWFYTCRLLDEKLSDLHRCSNLNTVKQIQAQVLKHDVHQDPYIAPKLVAAFSVSRHLPPPSTHSTSPKTRLTLPSHLKPSSRYKGTMFFQIASHTRFWMMQMIHAHVVKFGFFGSDIFVPNSLIDLYCKCGGARIDAAIWLFLEMEERDVVSWNSVIGGLVRGGEFEKACKVFDETLERDVVSWNIMLDMYAKAEEMGKVLEMFEGIPERNVVSWATMVWGYCRVGDMNISRMLFDKCPGKNLVIWTTMISGMLRRGLLMRQ